MTDVIPTRAEVLDKLAAEGGPAQIADFLLARGMVGEHETWRCPVARYVATTALDTIAVSGWVWADDTPGLIRGDYHPLPAPVVAFVAAFDRGEFPDLETEPPHIPF